MIHYKEIYTYYLPSPDEYDDIIIMSLNIILMYHKLLNSSPCQAKYRTRAIINRSLVITALV